jgi:hypothetical protein
MEIEQSAVAIFSSIDLNETHALHERLGFGSNPNGTLVRAEWPG